MERDCWRISLTHSLFIALSLLSCTYVRVCIPLPDVIMQSTQIHTGGVVQDKYFSESNRGSPTKGSTVYTFRKFNVEEQELDLVHN